MKPESTNRLSLQWRIRLLCSLLFFALSSLLIAQSGHRFSVQIEEYNQAQIFLYEYYGASPSKIDSAALNADSLFVFEGKESLRKGMYLFLLPPHNKAIQFFINGPEQHFSVSANYQQLDADHIHFKDSEENQLFYAYLRIVSSQNGMAQSFNQIYQTTESAEVKAAYRIKLDSLHRVVKEIQGNFASQYPKSMTAMLARLDKETPVPTFEGSDEEVLEKRYRFSRAHYFDHIDLADSSLLILPLFVRKVNNYLGRMIPQNADTLIITIDQLLGKMPKDEENYRYFVQHLLRTYEYPQYVGLDKVYVHLADNYIKEGEAKWLDDKDRKKIKKRAAQYRAILVGAPAPEVTLFKRDGSEISLYDIEADYTVLFFWRPGCGHCKKARPFLKTFYEEYKSKGIEIFSLCTNLRNTTPECWTYIDEHQLGDWINAADSNNSSRFVQKYNAGRTPKIYVLDKEKKILIKGFDAERLKEVMEKILKEEKE